MNNIDQPLDGHLNFKATIEINGVNPYVLVTAEQAARLKPDWRRPMPVLVQVNGKPDEPWYINMMPMGDGNFYLYLHGDVRKASGTAVGDEVEVSIVFDHGYRNGPQHPMPDEFQAQLAQNPAAEQNWQALPPSRQKEVLRNFANLKSDEAQQRSIAQAIIVLSGQDGHFMGRDWHAGK